MATSRLWPCSLLLALAACSLQHPARTGEEDVGADRPADDVAEEGRVDAGPEAALDVHIDRPDERSVPDIAVALDRPDDVALDREAAAPDVALDVAPDRGPQCAAAEEVCDGACVNLSNSSAHCGRCGTACALPELCLGGTCACPGGARACGGQCVNLLTDASNCGRCGNVCPTSQRCVDGTCACGDGRSLCDGRCVDLRADRDHCGACSVACGEGLCAAGVCACTSPRRWCAGRCLDTASDPMNCGSCGVTCGARACVGGACMAAAPTCAPGRGDCTEAALAGDPCETDLQTSPQHCGRCGGRCDGGRVCTGGQCVLPRTCAELHRVLPAAPSGRYTIRPSSSDVSVWCDMTTDMGGWTVIYLWNNPTRPATTMLDYTVPEAALRTMATQCLLAYRNAAYELVEGNWARFAMPAEWRAMSPFRSRSVDANVMVTTASGTSPRRLRFGYADFSRRCGDNWDTSRSAGRVCIEGLNTPFFAAFAPLSYRNIMLDYCPNSDQDWNATVCSPGRRFSIAVR